MNDLIEFLTAKEIIVVYIVAAVACLLCFIIYIIDKNYDKRKRKQNTKELNRLVDDVNIEIKKDLGVGEVAPQVIPQMEYIEPVLQQVEPIVIPPVTEVVPIINEVVNVPQAVEVEPVVQPVITEELPQVVEESAPSSVEEMILNTMPIGKEEPEIELIYTEVEPNQTEAQQQLLRLTEELEKAAEETKNIELTSFEETQEREAIISLEELMQKSKEMVASNEVSQYADEGDEPISLADLELKMKEAATLIEEPVIMEAKKDVAAIEPVQERMILDDFNHIQIEEPQIETPSYQEHRKFQSSPVISPIYGIEKKELSLSPTEIELENTANYDKLDEEIKKTNEFLVTLRELQKHLD